MTAARRKVRGYPATNDPLSHWVDEYYGGKKSTRAASNIVFSNGQLDPWSSGGVLTNESLPSSVYAEPPPRRFSLCSGESSRGRAMFDLCAVARVVRTALIARLV